MDDDQVKADFAERYRLMKGLGLKEMNQIRSPVCTLCRGHKNAGLAGNCKVGLRLNSEIR